MLLVSGTGHAQVASRLPAAAPRPASHSLEGIRSAFLANDPVRLAPHFPARQPVLVQVPPLERGGVLGPGPMKAFLSRLVAGRATTAFEVPDVNPDASPDIRMHVKVRWTYRETGSATLQVESLYLALRYAPEDAEWQIVEMRTASR